MLRCRGFIVVIVIGMLGVLAVLGVQMVNSARLSQKLAIGSLQSSRTYMLARSGIERGLTEINDRLNQVPPDYLSLSTGGFTTTFSMNVMFNGADQTTVDIKDPAGSININDGLSAGFYALGPNYDPQALEAWEDSNPPFGPIQNNDSGFINLRLRRLLNAYGDALLFTLDPAFGWPSLAALPPYGNPFTFSSTDAQAPYVPSPGGTGLGDRIIGARPGGGYKRIEEIRSTVNQWADDVGIDLWLGVGNQLYDLIRDDLTVESFEDLHFWGFKNEFGDDRDGNGFPDWSESVTVARVSTVFLDTAPPDLSDLWTARHPVPLININAASDLVRAAVFYAPTNVSYLCEGHYWVVANTSWTQSQLTSSRDSLGTGGPVFHESRLQENGVVYDWTNDAQVQINRFMSLRDALLWSQQYRLISEASSWPSDFNQFKLRLGDIRQVSQPERGLHHQDMDRNDPAWTTSKGVGPDMQSIEHTPRDMRFADGRAWFTNRYIEETLPHIFSTVRRMPGFMGAPLALLSPYTQELGGGTRDKINTITHLLEPNLGQERATRGDEVLRSVEDFVYRAPIPKVCFSSPGLFTIHSKATADGTVGTLDADIRVEVKAFERKIWRTQAQFALITDSDSQNVTTGPENTGAATSNFLGVVGPVTRKSDLPGSPGYKTELFFDTNLDVSAGSSMKVANIVGDTFVSGSEPLYNNLGLQNSELEQTGSVFATGSLGNDLTPFGGVMLSSRGHGTFSPNFFSDSLYFRPYHMMSGINMPNLEYTGRYFNKGVVSCWVRAPSGFQHANTKRTIFHLTLWDKIQLYDAGDTNTLISVNRPSFISAYFQGHGRTDDWNEKPAPVSTYFSVSYYKAPDGFFGDVQLDPALINNNLRLVDYPPTTADIVNVPYSYGLLHPNTMQFGGIVFPPTAWEDFWEDAQDNKFLLSMPRKATDFWQCEATDPYAYRPGGWVKVICKWDLNNYLFDRSQISGLLAQGGAGMALTYDTNTVLNTTSFQFPPSEAWFADENTFNSRMVLSVGERIQFRTNQDQPGTDEKWGQSALVRNHFLANQNNAMPMNRLNSSVDDFMIWTGYGAGMNNGTMPGMLEGSSPGYANRYNLTTQTYSGLTEPRWTVNPGVPTNTALLAVRSRIYDVPYDSAFGEPVGIAWPRIAIEVEQNTSPLTPVTTVTTTVDGKVRTSPSVLQFSGEKVDSNLRLKFIWKPETPWGATISHPEHVFDAPWIEDVQIDYRVKGIQVQHWTEE